MILLLFLNTNWFFQYLLMGKNYEEFSRKKLFLTVVKPLQVSEIQNI